MAIKQETINQFEGFGNDNKIARGEYHRSSGMKKSKNGITSIGLMSHLLDFTSLTDLGASVPTGMAYGRSRIISTQVAQNHLIVAGQSGEIIQSLAGTSTTGEYLHRAIQNHAYFMGIIIDPKGRLLYHQDRYLGMFDANSGTTNYVTGTVAMGNGNTAVVGIGTTFNAGMVGKVLRITGAGTDKKFYTIASYTDATHITLSSAYQGSTTSSVSYVINDQFNDTWKDFGAIVTTPNGTSPQCAMDIYEDTVIFGRGNVITTLNVTTDTVTTDASPSLNLPAGYSIEHIVSNSNGILIAGNVRGKGFALLWDNLSDRAIAPWIWFEDTVYSVCKNGSEWIIITGRGTFQTNGYSTVLILDEILDNDTSIFINNSPRNSIVINNYLHFGGYNSNGGRRRNVMYRVNLATKLVEAIPRYTMDQYNPIFSRFEYVSDAYRLYTLVKGVGTEQGVDYFAERNSSICTTYVSGEITQGSGKKVAQRVRIKIRKNTTSSSAFGDSFSFKIALKIADCKANLYKYAQIKSTSTEYDKITVDGTNFPAPKVGYEVEFTGAGSSSSLNNLGYSRNIASISGAGTATEIWTLDSALPAYAQINQSVSLTPFQLVKRKTITVTNGEIEEIEFDVKNSIKSKKFMIKVDIEDNTSFIPLEIEPIELIYDDQGVL